MKVSELPKYDACQSAMYTFAMGLKEPFGKQELKDQFNLSDAQADYWFKWLKDTGDFKTTLVRCSCKENGNGIPKGSSTADI